MNSFNIKLLQKTYLLMLQDFLSGNITAIEFEKHFLKDWPDLADKFYPSPFDSIISTLFLDIDAFWSEYDQNEEDHKNDLNLIDEVELKRRCSIHYSNLLELIKLHKDQP